MDQNMPQNSCNIVYTMYQNYIKLNCKINVVYEYTEQKLKVLLRYWSA